MIDIIISASRRTDIPAFYGEWFMHRIREGSFIKVNPYNPKQRKLVTLSPLAIEAIVFWTKHPLPFLQVLPLLDEMGYSYYFQYTLNDYPQLLEPYLPPLAERIEVFQRLSEQIGPEKVIWRYDPIIISKMTPPEYHLEHFTQLASALQNYSHRVMISFLTLYDKVQARIGRLEEEHHLQITEIRKQPDVWESLARDLSRIAGQNDFQISSCSETVDLTKCGILPGSCIDGAFINQLFNLKLTYKKDKAQRQECRCVESVDMGFYNTCKFNCSYCYANFNERMVARNVAQHYPDSRTMVGKNFTL